MLAYSDCWSWYGLNNSPCRSLCLTYMKVDDMNETMATDKSWGLLIYIYLQLWRLLTDVTVYTTYLSEKTLGNQLRTSNHLVMFVDSVHILVIIFYTRWTCQLLYSASKTMFKLARSNDGLFCLLCTPFPISFWNLKRKLCILAKKSCTNWKRPYHINLHMTWTLDKNQVSKTIYVW